MVPVIKEVPSLLHWPFLTQDFTSGPHSQLYTKNPLNIASDPLSTKNSPYVPNFSEIFNISNTWYSLGLHFLPCLSLSCNKSYIFAPKLPALSTGLQILHSYQQNNSFGARVSDRELLSCWPSHQVLERIKPQNKKSFHLHGQSPFLIPADPASSLLFGSPLATQAPSQLSFFFLQLHLIYYLFLVRSSLESSSYSLLFLPLALQRSSPLSLSLLHCCSSLFHELATASSFISIFTPI